MDHVAIMKASWRMTEKIARGEKTIESRWLRHKASPWNKVSVDDRIFFKDSGKPVRVVARVSRVECIENVNGPELIARYGKELCLSTPPSNKNVVILIFLKDPKCVKPFSINKKGFGAMSAWITVKDIDDIRI
jgi:hypothetical protein